jgi:hydrogenase nickel incorporation protein HypA/HybF
MHELSIAMSILDVVEEAAQRRGDARVAVIHLKVGPLSGVVKEALISAFALAREGTMFAECELMIEDVPLIAFCPLCAVDREIPSVQYICCPVCDTPTPEVVSGRELDVVAMEVCA